MKIRRRVNCSIILISLLIAMNHAFVAMGDAGDLDLTFGIDGKVTTDFNSSFDRAAGIVVQPDGKIVAVGDSAAGSDYEFAVARYNPDGSLDLTFSFDGKVTTSFGAGEEGALGVALQADGKIVVAGYANTSGISDFVLARYNPDGSLDASFDFDGRVVTDFSGGNDAATAVAIQPDGKILAAGYAVTGGSYNFGVCRYNSDGSLDSTFDSDGRAAVDFAVGFDSPYGMAIQTDGKIILAGTASISSLNELAVARFHGNGSIDTSFSGDGKATINFNGLHSFAQDVAVQADGLIVVLGESNDDFILARFNTDGSLDLNFDGDGKVITDFAGGEDRAQSLAIQADGKIVAAGSVESAHFDFALARYNPDGSLDLNFGGGGKVSGIFNGTSFAYAITIQSDGKIIAAGSTANDFALARYSSNTAGSLFFDDFEDGSTSNWTHIKPVWIESGGALIGTPSGRKAVAIASPGFTGCENCTIETSMQTAGGAFNKLWLLGWYLDKRNTIELLMKEENDRWILKHRINGAVVSKAKGIKTIDPNTPYIVRVAFDGSAFQVFVDDLVTPLFTLNSPAPVSSGTIGFQVKSTTGNFSYIAVD